MQKRTPFAVSDFCTVPDEPAMRCYPAISRERCVQSSLPCVSSSGKKSQASKLMALSVGRFLWKDCLQKRIETGKIRCGNHLGCPSGAEMGLRYGLSGNRVSVMETDRLGRERETASFGDERFAHGENKPDLSRKINHFCRHCFIFAQHRPNLTHRRLHFFPPYCGKILANPSGFAVAFPCLTKKLSAWRSAIFVRSCAAGVNVGGKSRAIGSCR